MRQNGDKLPIKHYDYYYSIDRNHLTLMFTGIQRFGNVERSWS